MCRFDSLLFACEQSTYFVSYVSVDYMYYGALTLLLSEWPKLYGVLAVLSAIGLKRHYMLHNMFHATTFVPPRLCLDYEMCCMQETCCINHETKVFWGVYMVLHVAWH